MCLVCYDDDDDDDDDDGIEFYSATAQPCLALYAGALSSLETRIVSQKCGE